MGDNAAGTFFTDFRARTRAFFIQHGMLPAIIFRLVPDCLETPFRIGGGAATFECVRKISHLCMMRARDLKPRDTQGCAALRNCCASQLVMTVSG
jgi:hypothetical protein